MNTNFDDFICKVCLKYFLDPVILPCENDVCEEHVKQKIIENDNKKKEYQCELCQSKHEVPMNGFIKNRFIINMMTKNNDLNELNRNIKKSIDDLDNVNKELDSISKDPEGVIYSYYFNARNKIDLRRETLISKINDISDDMIAKIKESETNCKSNLIERQNLMDEEFDYNLSTKQMAEWREMIRDPKIHHNKVFEESTKLLNKNEEKLLEAKSKLLNEKGCFFIVDNEFKNDYFGKLIIDDFKTINMHEKYNYEKYVSYSIFKHAIQNSNVLAPYQVIDLFKLCEFNDISSLKLLYRASRDGFSSNAFHSKCDKIPKTLTIIKVKDQPHIFGGYTEATWEEEGYKQDPNAFIFSLVNNDNEPIKMKINQDTENAIYCDPSYGPTFGKEGDDFYISSDSDIHENSYSYLGDTYQHPNYQENPDEEAEANKFLAGSCCFSTSEIEVFQIL